MKRLMAAICACAIAALAFSSVASAADDHSSSADAKRCTAEQRADSAAFKALYGDHAMRHCIHGAAGEPTVSEFKNAAKECKAERDADAATFQTTYGSESSKGRNALGKCVSGKVKHTGDDEGDDDDQGDDDQGTDEEESP